MAGKGFLYNWCGELGTHFDWPTTFDVMLVSSGAPLNLWGEAVLSACHIQNRIPYEKKVCKLVKSLYGLK